MKHWLTKNIVAALVVAASLIGVNLVVRKFHVPGHIDVVTAQAMDMSEMRPPIGAAPVALAAVRTGSLGDTVTYTGSVKAYNEQDIGPRITGALVSLPVYPGDQVHAGQLVAQLDTTEVGAKAGAAAAEADEAGIAAHVAVLTHHLHHHAALDQAESQVQAAIEGVSDATAQAQADQEAVADTQAGVQSAQANVDYWKLEIAREKRLADAGAVSQQEYQNELAQSQAAQAALDQDQAKVREAVATAASARARELAAKRQVDIGEAGVRMAQADLVVASGAIDQARAGAQAAEESAREAATVASYARITSPGNGVVTDRPVAPGTLVQPGTTILRIAEIDRVRIQANVAVEDVSGIHVGSPVTISVSGGAPIQTHVTSIFPAANEETRTAIVEAILPNPGHELLPGAFVTMRITKNTVTNKLLVPTSTVVSLGGQSYVWTASVSGAAAGIQYKAHCGFVYTAAFAKAHNYICPMDHLPLTPIIPATVPGEPGLTAHEIAITTGASDGAWTEVASGPLAPSARVVTHGQSGLTDGARVVATQWGPNGPITLPTAASADQGMTVYRCEKCGMTYSAADAAKDHYVDPMDGGKLVPVTAATR